MTNPTNKRPLADRIRECHERHPEWDDARIASAVRGSTRAAVRAVMRGEPIPEPPAVPENASVAVPADTAGMIDIGAVRKRYDIAAAIRSELAVMSAGTLMVEREMCQRTAGKDISRFRRAVENNADFRANRVKLRLDPDHPDGTWYWGRAADVAEAIRLRDE